jgi:hypothetical protein
MPLKTIKERLEKDPGNEALEEIEWFLESRGATVDWKS